MYLFFIRPNIERNINDKIICHKLYIYIHLFIIYNGRKRNEYIEKLQLILFTVIASSEIFMHIKICARVKVCDGIIHERYIILVVLVQQFNVKHYYCQ